MKKEISLALATFVVAGFCMFSNMSDMMYIGIHGIAIAIFILFAILIWRSKPADERDAQNRAVSSDIAFTVGGTLLAIAMIYQIYIDMEIDVWLMAVLVGMIAARVIGRLWLEKNR